MSYYNKYNYNFTDHALWRIKQRLKLENLQDWEVKEICIKHILNSTKTFQTRNEIYISASNTNMFFVVSRNSNTIITFTSISLEKQLGLNPW